MSSQFMLVGISGNLMSIFLSFDLVWRFDLDLKSIIVIELIEKFDFEVFFPQKIAWLVYGNLRPKIKLTEKHYI
jgi:hypothetical protein